MVSTTVVTVLQSSLCTKIDRALCSFKTVMSPSPLTYHSFYNVNRYNFGYFSDSPTKSLYVQVFTIIELIVSKERSLTWSRLSEWSFY